MGILHEEPSGVTTPLRAVARGGTHAGDLAPPQSSSQGFITEGDLSGGGGQPTTPAPTELGARAAIEMLAEQLRQAERNLAMQHEGVMRLVGQLLGESVPANISHWPANGSLVPANGTLAPANGVLLHAGGALVPATGSLMPASSSFMGAYAGPGRLDKVNHPMGATELVPALDPAPERPSSEGRPGNPVPCPEFDAPRMHLPGELELEEEELQEDVLPLEHENTEEQEELHPDDQKKNDHFELHESFLKITRKRKEMKTQHMMSAVVRKVSMASVPDELAASQVNKTDGCCRHLMLNPNSPLRAFWDIMSMMLVLYDMVMVPFGFFEPEVTVGMLVMNWTTRIFWTNDIPISFTSGFVTSDGSIEMRPRLVAKKYAKSWFFLDIIVVGSDWTEIILGQAMAGMDMARMSKFARIFRILRMIRLLRLAKVGEIVNLLAERLPSEKLVVFIDILKLIVIMLGIGHVLACVWYVIGKELGPSDRNGWNWLAKYDFLHEALEYRYIMSMRWALSQFAGGMDEVTPVSLAEHIYAGFVYIFAFWSGTVFLSILTSHFTQLYIMGNQQSQQLNVMRRYLSQNGISKSLVLRVTRNAQHTMKMRQRATPEAAVGLLELVSEPLRIELHHEMYFPLLGLHPFFSDYMKACPFVVRKICHAAMSMSTYSKDDVIFHFGEAASRMLLVRSGTLVYNYGSNLVENLTEGRWLSEMPLWTHWAHRGVLTAIEDSVLFCVSATLFQNIVGMFEIAVFDPCEYAKMFVNDLNNVSGTELSDLPIKKSKVFSRWGSKGLTKSFEDDSHNRARSRMCEIDVDELVSLDSGDEGHAKPAGVQEVREGHAPKRSTALSSKKSQRRSGPVKVPAAGQVQKRATRTTAAHPRVTAAGLPGSRPNSRQQVPSIVWRPLPASAAGSRLVAVDGGVQAHVQGRALLAAPARFEEQHMRPASQERANQVLGSEEEFSRRLQLSQLEDLCEEEEV